ncbi:VanZ family protein [Bacillus salacetis]|uniref:VanZ family protein n=1 Tax=Bacillus salacetis TaxID=2315464 RepID=A0A3A1QNY8_9BACI|nr:VanZ family protein [Bacillus salacetis]RIW27281.1 VanZ family protein [Bacillus salacetis]
MQVSYQQLLLILIFIFYFTMLTIVSFLYIDMRIFNLSIIHYDEVKINLVPFSTIGKYLLNFEHYNSETWLNNTIGVTLIYSPLGFLLPLTFVNLNSLKKVLLFTIFLSVLIEVLQFITKLGVLDIDDVILNVIGATLGYVIYKVFFRNKLTKR